MAYIVSGGTGFLGRNVLPLLLDRDRESTVYVLVRRASVQRMERLAASWVGGDRVVPIVGDLTEPGLGASKPILRTPTTCCTSARSTT
jgi:thioester reductase-like protein